MNGYIVGITDNLLFVYGTLLDEDNEYALYLQNNSRFHSAGKLKGKLYDIGEYPWAILSDVGEVYIYGSVLEINNPEKVFPVIDDYEGFGKDQLQPNEFIRALADVETGAGLISCWVYLYNLSITGLIQLKNGRYTP